MDSIDLKHLARKRERLRSQGTINPFCCACGERHWGVRYELNHILWRRHDDRVMRLCHSCHDKVSEMQREYPPIPSSVDPVVAKLIALFRGRIIHAKLFMEIDEEFEALLSGRLQLPQTVSPDAEEGDDNGE